MKRGHVNRLMTNVSRTEPYSNTPADLKVTGDLTMWTYMGQNPLLSTLYEADERSGRVLLHTAQVYLYTVHSEHA